ncbi:MAG: DUF1015 domain-containing protein [Oscillospiraceae bacterium]|jgi:uncharacterized protein (DUF1015 family)
MATIKAFGALRFTPKAGSLEELTCPPYDIISEEEREAYLARNPHNIIRLELPREGQDPYQQAQATFREWMDQGILATDQAPGLYLYEEVFTVAGEQKSLLGLCCMVKLEEFEKGVVLPHEQTLSKAKTDRFNLMTATGCNFSSVYCLYFDEENNIFSRLEAATQQEPLEEFQSADGITHRVWKIEDPAEIQKISTLFEEKKLYIADGHHRYETALNYRNSLMAQGRKVGQAHYVMMTLMHMEHPGLVVFPTHRVVHGLEQFDAQQLLKDCGEHFTLTQVAVGELEGVMKQAEQAGEKVLGLCLPQGAYLLKLRSEDVMKELLPQASKAYQLLDVNVLHLLILERFLGIDKENMANQRNLYYTRDAEEAFATVSQGKANCAFLLNATKVEEIADVAAAGEKMPQKSTYFYPKLITGHLMAKLL